MRYVVERIKGKTFLIHTYSRKFEDEKLFVLTQFLRAKRTQKKSPDICQGSFFTLAEITIKQQQLQFQYEH